jgi:energy-coupling factor transport system substrate-specific component
MDGAFILELVCDKEDNIWGVSRSGKVFILKDGQIKHIFDDKEMLGHSAASLITLHEGTVAIGTADGWVAASAIKNDSYVFQWHPSSPVKGINALYEDSSRRLWVCGDNGLGYYENNYHFNFIEGSLIQNSIEKIFEDYEGGLWIASSRQGLLHISKNKFSDINFAASIPRYVVNATESYGGLLYAGTDQGIYAVDKRRLSRVENSITKKFEGVRVRSIMRDSKNRLWVGTFNAGGLACINPDGRIKFYTKKDGLPNENIRMILERRNGDVAAATNNGVGVIRDGKIVRTYTQKDGMLNTTILNMCEDDKGRLYLGTDGSGVFEVNGDRLKNYNKNYGLKSGVVMRLLYDFENHGIWVSTAYSLGFLSRSAILPVYIPQGVTGAGIYDIKKDLNGNLMLLTDTGVYIAKTEDLLGGKIPVFTSYSRNNGLPSSITANSWNYMDKNGSLYLCCSDGIYSIDVSNVSMNGKNPKIGVKTAEIDGTVYENPKNLVLSSDVKRMTLELAVLSFVNPENNKIEYRLEGFDNEDISGFVKDIGRVTYTNLKGGRYKFIFRGMNGDGIRSLRPVTMVIEKKKTLMEQPAFLLLLNVVIFIFIFSVIRFLHCRKEKMLLSRQEELHKIMSQAISAIANTIDAKDPYTRGHSTRVAGYAVSVAKKMGYSDSKLDNLYYTALLHDIGKIGIPDEILKKHEGLTEKEYEIIKQHPAIGGEILKTITVISEIKEGAAFHHEKYDGTGYNNGLKGEEIPLTARIICVADAFDAMASTRPYRKHTSMEYIISEFEKNSGTQFDPHISKIFVEMLRSGEITAELEPKDTI